MRLGTWKVGVPAGNLVPWRGGAAVLSRWTGICNGYLPILRSVPVPRSSRLHLAQCRQSCAAEEQHSQLGSKIAEVADERNGTWEATPPGFSSMEIS